MKLRRRSPCVLPSLAIAFLALAAADCESLKAPPPGDDPNEDNDPLGYTEPADLVEAFAAAHEALDLEAYTALLHDHFEFTPRPSDADDFPWMTGDSWDRAQELSIASHLFDPNYSGYEAPIQSIDMTATIVSQETNDDGSREAVAQVNGTFLNNATDGWSFDGRLIFHLVTVDGFLKVREIREIELFRPSASVEESSLASIKNLYR